MDRQLLIKAMQRNDLKTIRDHLCQQEDERMMADFHAMIEEQKNGSYSSRYSFEPDDAEELKNSLKIIHETGDYNLLTTKALLIIISVLQYRKEDTV